MFSEEATFHIANGVHGHIVKILGTVNLHIVRVHICDSPKANVLFVSMHNRVTGLFFFQ
jgi:hypothetical protein